MHKYSRNKNFPFFHAMIHVTRACSNRWRIAERIKFGCERVITVFDFEGAIGRRYARFYGRKSANHALLTERNHRLRNSGSRFALFSNFCCAIIFQTYTLSRQSISTTRYIRNFNVYIVRVVWNIFRFHACHAWVVIYEACTYITIIQGGW